MKNKIHLMVAITLMFVMVATAQKKATMVKSLMSIQEF